MKRLVYTLVYVIKIHLTGLLGLSFFRGIQLLIDYPKISDNSSIHLEDVIQSLLNGIHFDYLVLGYLALLPVTCLLILSYFKKDNPHWLLIPAYCIQGIHVCLALISALNMLYFECYTKNLNYTIFLRIREVITQIHVINCGLIVWIFVIFLVTITFMMLVEYQYFRDYYKQISRIIQNTSQKSNINSFRTYAFYVTVCSTVTFGVFRLYERSRREGLYIGSAYYCNDAILNQLGINPVYNLWVTYRDQQSIERLELMDDQKAFDIVKRDFSKRQISTNTRNFSRNIEYQYTGEKKNIVLLFTHSSSSQCLANHRKNTASTSFLDSLYYKSITLDNVYTSGARIEQRVFSTLYSYPSILDRNIFKNSNIIRLDGLPQTFQKEGYSTLFFMPFNPEYNNTNAFLRTNGFNQIYAKDDMPSTENENGFTVYDHELLNFSLDRITEEYKDRPFFASILMGSNFECLKLPANFKPRSNQMEDAMTEYVDHSLGQFFVKAQKEPWFEHTIFIFIGDQGEESQGNRTPVTKSDHLTPVMFYHKHFLPYIHHGIGGLVDVAPSLLHLLRISHKQRHLGFNLFQKERNYICYSTDDKLFCRSKKKLYVFKPEKEQSYFYKYCQNSRYRISTTKDPEYDEMKRYALSTLQTTEYLLEHGKTFN